MARRSRKKEEDIEAYRHERDTRKNAVPVGLASYDTLKPKPKKYDYNIEHTSFEVPTVSLHIHERIAPEAIIHPTKREPAKLTYLRNQIRI